MQIRAHAVQVWALLTTRQFSQTISKRCEPSGVQVFKALGAQFEQEALHLVHALVLFLFVLYAAHIGASRLLEQCKRRGINGHGGLCGCRRGFPDRGLWWVTKPEEGVCLALWLAAQVLLLLLWWEKVFVEANFSKDKAIRVKTS